MTTSRRVSTSDVSRNRSRQILLLDTCLLIDHLRGFDPARLWLTTTVAREDAQLACSVITAREIGAALATRDGGHFPMTDIEVFAPY